MLVCGIDPGQSGAMAFLGPEDAPYVVKASNCTPKDLAEELKALKPRIKMCYLERVHSMPKQGVASTFKFGVNFGTYIGILTAADIPFTYVIPAKWQGFLGCRSRGDKNVTKRKAQELFPSLTITHITADALLIAEYGRRYECLVDF